MAAGERVEILRNLTNLEFLNALRRLQVAGAVSKELAESAVKSFIELPATRRDVTQPMVARIWELRHNATAYDAAYVALVERLQAEQRRGDVTLATLDTKLANAPGMQIHIELFRS